MTAETISGVILFSSNAILWSHMGGGRNGPIQNSNQLNGWPQIDEAHYKIITQSLVDIM